MATQTVYSDPIDFVQNAAMGVETASLLGLSTTVAVAAIAGATTLQTVGTAPAGTTFPLQVYVMDGANTEIIQVASITGSANPYTLNLVAGTTLAAAHAVGVSVSSAGATGGCLADAILWASAEIESLCKQGPDGGADRSLYAKSRTEILSGPSYRAAFDRDGQLLLRPYHFPITSVPSVSVRMGGVSATGIDLSFLALPDGARSITIAQPQVVGSSPAITSMLGWWWPRQYAFYATITYTGGPCVTGATPALSGVPNDVRTACHLLVQDYLGFRRNPTGAAMIRQGDFTIEARLRGETTGESILMKRAKTLLQPFTVQPGM